MAQNIFKLVLTDEAQNFIESYPKRYLTRFTTTSSVLQVENATKNSSRSWKTRRYGNFVHCITKLLIACLLLGQG